MTIPQLTIRPEMERDRESSELLTRNAFWNVYSPGCREHLILHRLRNAPGFIPELNLVAEREGFLIGHAMATKAKIVDSSRKEENKALCLGPLSVSPDCQKKGIGGELMRAIESKARELGFRAIILIGHPGYYNRFGYQCTRPWNIKLPGVGMIDELMLLELYPGSMKGISGDFFPDPAFEVSDEDVDDFDKHFPPREKHVTNTQLS